MTLMDNERPKPRFADDLMRQRFATEEEAKAGIDANLAKPVSFCVTYKAVRTRDPETEKCSNQIGF